MAALKNSRNIALSGALSRVDNGGVVLSTGGIAAIVFPPGSNTPVPSSITITATTRLYNNPIYVWEFRYGTSGTWTAIANTTNILNVTLDPAWVTAAGTNVVVQYRLTVTQTGFNTSQEILSLPLLRSAASSVVIDLSNDSVTIATNTDGSGGNYSRATTSLSIFSGTTDVLPNLTNLLVTPSTGVTFSFTKNGTTTGGNTTAQSISISPAISSFSVAIISIATAQDGGTLTISATYNGVVYIAVFSVTKGKAGENALVYEVEADSQISLNINTNVFSPATVTYYAYSISGIAPRAAYSSGIIILESSTNGSTWTQISSTSGATASLTTSTLANTVRFVRAKLQVGTTIVDQETDALTVSGTNGLPGTAATNNGTAQLYQWATGQPANPNGTSTWTWSTGINSGYTGTDSWQTTIPANPGTPGIKLWIAAKQITAQAGTSSTSVDWTTGTISVYASSLNGLNGVQSASPTVYQWAASIPTISGTSTYTWSSGSFSPDSFGSWTPTPGTSPSVGFTLWAATVKLTDSATATTSPINWTTATISAVGYAGTNGGAGSQGASSRLAYARIANNPVPTSGTITVTGDATPSAAQSLSTWGINVSWSANDPDPSSTSTLYQSDGIYNPATGTTAWSTPYISSLKVGSLSAITVNTGALTVQDTLTVSSTGSIRGGQTGYNTGTGFFIGYSDGAYKLSIGNPSGNRIGWDGSGLTIIGSIATGTVINGAVTLSSGTPLSTVESNASTALSNAATALVNANNALNQLPGKLSSGSSYNLTGVVDVVDSGAIKVGSVTWNSTTGAVTGGTGVVFTENGITAVKNGATTFSLTNAGDATFAGALSAATGTFSGTLQAAGGTFTGTLQAAGGTFTGSLNAATGSFAGSLSVGSGNTILNVDTGGNLWIGNTAFSSAPFRVSNTGALTATSATITGTLSAGSVIVGSVTLSGTGTSLSTIETNASTANTNATNALNGLSTRLQASSSYSLTGVVDVVDSGAIRVGSVTWNSSTGAVTGGTGVVFTENGITGVNGGDVRFSITNQGNATFKGDISGSTGSFAGQITSGTTSDGVVISPNGLKVVVGGVVRVRIGNLTSW
jgi:hypothetical protein